LILLIRNNINYATPVLGCSFYSSTVQVHFFFVHFVLFKKIKTERTPKCFNRFNRDILIDRISAFNEIFVRYFSYGKNSVLFFYYISEYPKKQALICLKRLFWIKLGD